MRRRAPKSLCCKVYPLLLAICYLECLLWLSCLLLSCAAVAPSSDSHQFLVRETSNFKFAGSEQPSFPTLPGFDQANYKVATRVEHCFAQRQAELSSFGDPGYDALGLSPLRGFPAATGLPAPYTGIKALS